MKKLKIILLFSTFIYVLIVINKGYPNSKLDNDTSLIGKIINIQKYDNKTVLTIKSKENLLANYYDDLQLDIKLGDIVKIDGIIEIPSENNVFNQFNYRKYLLSKKIYRTIKMEKIVVVKNNNNFFYKIKNNIIIKIES